MRLVEATAPTPATVEHHGVIQLFKETRDPERTVHIAVEKLEFQVKSNRPMQDKNGMLSEFK